MKKLILIFAVYISFLSFLTGQGLQADYYNGIDFQEYVGTSTVSKIDFYWNEIAPIKGLDPNNCSVLYSGQLKSPRSGVVTFSARVDDGLLVWIGDELIISNWQLNDVGLSEGKIYLEANKNYDIKIKYFNAMREAELELLWKLPDDPKRSWFSKLWYGDRPVIISSKYFNPPSAKKSDVLKA